MNIFKQKQNVLNQNLNSIQLPFKLILKKLSTVAELAPENYQHTIILLPPLLQTHLSVEIQNTCQLLFNENFRIIVVIQPGLLNELNSNQILDHDFLQLQELLDAIQSYPNSYLLGFESGAIKIFEVIQRKDININKCCIINCPFDWLSFIPSNIDEVWNLNTGKQLKEYYLRNQKYFQKFPIELEKLDKFLDQPSFTGFDDCFWCSKYEMNNLEELYQHLIDPQQFDNVLYPTLIINAYNSPITSSYINKLDIYANDNVNYILTNNGQQNAINTYNEDLFIILVQQWFNFIEQE
eukprot:EST45956.1 Hypothetical protein SS50377_13935 [Spironucleus salmonicida]